MREGDDHHADGGEQENAAGTGANPLLRRRTTHAEKQEQHTVDDEEEAEDFVHGKIKRPPGEPERAVELWRDGEGDYVMVQVNLATPVSVSETPSTVRVEVTLSVTAKGPGALGVPLMTPAVLHARPVGRPVAV